jgi:hypothetical protein
VFGFFNPLVEATPDGLAMENQSLSYLVIGWYSDAACDPIQQESLRMGKDKVTPDSLAEALKANYGWSYRAGLGQPGQTLFVGQLIDLEYDPRTSYLAQTKEPAPIDRAWRNDHRGVFCFDGLLSDLDKIGTETCLATLRDELHRRDFAVYSAGHASEQMETGVIWSVELADEESSSRIEIAEAAVQALPDDVARKLNSLNLVQASYDEIAAAVATRRAQVFADWSSI